MDKDFLVDEKNYFLNGGKESVYISDQSKWLVRRRDKKTSDYELFIGNKCDACCKPAKGMSVYFTEVWPYNHKYDTYDIEKTWFACCFRCATQIRNRRVGYYDNLPRYVDAMNYRVPGHFEG